MKKKFFIKSQLFYKSYIINCLLSIVLIVSFSTFCIYYFTTYITNQLMDFNKQLYTEKQTILSEKLKNIDNQIYSSISQNYTFQTLVSQSDFKPSPLKILDIIKHFNIIVSNNKEIEHIEFFDCEMNYAITNLTTYNFDEKPKYLEEMKNDIVFTFDKTKNQYIYARHFRHIGNQKSLFISFYLNKDIFEKDIFVNDSEQNTISGILFNDTFFTTNSKYSKDNDITNYICSIENGSFRKTIDDKEYLIFKNSIDDFPINYVIIKDFTQLMYDVSLMKKTIIFVSIIVVVLVNIIIYFIDLNNYKPLKRLTDTVQNISGNSMNRSFANEYTYIEKKFNELNEIQTKAVEDYNRALPSLISEIFKSLLVERFNNSNYEQLLKLTKTKMGYKNYIILILDCVNKNDNYDMCINLRKFITENSKTEVIFGFKDKAPSSLGIMLFNTELEYNVLIDMIKDYKKSINDMYRESFWAISNIFNDITKLNINYIKTLHLLEQKFFHNKNSIILEKNQDIPLEEINIGMEKKQLIKAIQTNASTENITKHLDALLEPIIAENNNIQYTRYKFYEISIDLLHSLIDSGNTIPQEYSEKDIFNSFFNANNIVELKGILTEIIYDALKCANTNPQQYSVTVAKTIEYISNNYQKDIALEEISDTVFLSVGYLSNIFKEETGYTIYEYITYVRMTEAKKLLENNPKMKIKEISEQVGYNNVQSFIRYFKKYYKLTPMEFRKNTNNLSV